MSRFPHINEWVIFFTGAFQNNRRPSGLELLYYDVRSLKGNGSREIMLRTWHDDYKGLASRIARHSHQSCKIFAIGYSWGGQTAASFCKELQGRGYKAEWLLLCDAVWRSPLFWRWGRSLMPGYKIEVPDNVRNVWACYQRTTRPQGHGLVLENRNRTRLQGWVEFEKIQHIHMDDQSRFHNKVKEALQCVPSCSP